MTETTTRPTPEFATSAGMLEFFHARFDMSLASDSELQFLANGSNEIINMASSLACVANGIASLICADQSEDGKAQRSGALQEGDQITVLCSIAHQFLLIEQVACITSTANWCLQKRLTDRLKVERSRRGHDGEYSSWEGV